MAWVPPAPFAHSLTSGSSNSQPIPRDVERDNLAQSTPLKSQPQHGELAPTIAGDHVTCSRAKSPRGLRPDYRELLAGDCRCCAMTSNVPLRSSVAHPNHVFVVDLDVGWCTF